jgi:hypothetical protein
VQTAGTLTRQFFERSLARDYARDGSLECLVESTAEELESGNVRVAIHLLA